MTNLCLPKKRARIIRQPLPPAAKRSLKTLRQLTQQDNAVHARSPLPIHATNACAAIGRANR